MQRMFALFLTTVLLLSQLQIGVISSTYADDLENTKQKTIEALDKVEVVVDNAIEKLDSKTSNSKKKKRLDTKQKEIQEYIDEVQQDISDENSTGDIKALAAEAHKTVVLKVVSGATEYENIEDNISQDIAETKTEISQATQVLQDSLETESGDYSIIVKTKYKTKKLKKLFAKFDTSIKIDFLYTSKKQNYYEVFIGADSIFTKEMLEDIGRGNLPKAFLSVEIVAPEIFAIEKLTPEEKAEKKLQKLLTGEDLTQTWGIEQYQAYRYFADTKKPSKKIKIAVVDTGIDYTHSDLKDRVNQKLGRDFVNKDKDAFDDQGHGTHVAGTIAAAVNKGGIIGVNPYTKLVPLKICDSNGFCPSYAVLRALNYAKKKNIDIVNMSLGGRANPTNHAICAGISDYVQNGGIVVSASGNSNINTNQFVPGGCSDAITVGAHDTSGAKAVFSNYGDKVDVLAPGVDIYSTAPGETYKKLSGTSMAAPHITGLVSLMQAYSPDITSNQIKTLLKNNSQPFLNTETLFTELNNQSFVEVIPEPELIEKEEEVVVVDEVIPGKDTYNTGEAILDTNIVPLPNFVRESTENIDDTFTPTITSSNIQTLDFGEYADVIGINSQNNTQTQKIDIQESQESQKQYLEPRQERVFNEFGETEQNPIAINSTEILETVEPSLGEVKLADIIENKFNVQEDNNSGDEDIKIQELFIDGAEKDIKINSSEDYIGKDIIFNTSEDGVVLPSDVKEIQLNKIESSQYLHDDKITADTSHIQNNVTITSQGYLRGPDVVGYEPGDNDISDILGETKKDITPSVVSALPSYDDELIIDGAQKSITINNISTTPELIEIDSYTENNIPEIIESDVVIENFETTPLEGDMIESIDFKDIDFVIQDSGSIETPTDIFDTPDDIGEDEIFEGVTTNPELDDSGVLGIQRTYSCSISLGETCSFSIYKSYNYEFGVDVEDIVTHRTSKRTLYFDAKSVGTTQYTLSRSGRLYHTIYVTVNEPQVQEQINLTIEEESKQNIEIPYDRYEQFVRVTDGGLASRARNGGTITFEGKTAGIDTYYLRNYRTGVFSHKIKITVTKKPPIFVDLDVYQNQSIRQVYMGVHSLDGSYQVSNNNIAVVGDGYNNIKITGTHIGKSEIYASYKGKHTHTFNVTVKPIPVPKKYSITVEEGKTVEVYFPDNGYNEIYSIVPGNTGYSLLFNYPGYVGIQGSSSGKITYNIGERDGPTHYIIDVTVIPKKPTQIHASIYEGRITSLQIKDADDYQYSVTQSGIMTMRSTSSRLYITGSQPGNTQILLSLGGVDKYIIDVETKPLPEPEVIRVNNQEFKTTTVSLPSGSKNIAVTNSGIARATHRYDSATGKLTITGQVLGKVTYTVTNNTTSFVEYIVEVNISPEPPELREVSVWQTKNLNLGSFSEVDASRFAVIDTNILSAYRSGQYVYITGVNGGTTDLYIYSANGRHAITYRVTVFPKPEPVVYPLNLIIGGSAEVTLPENISSYNFSITNNSPFRDHDGDIRFTTTGDRTFSFPAYRSGKSKIYLKDTQGFSIYIIDIDVSVRELELTLIKTESKDPGLSANDNHYSDDSSIASIKNGDEIYGVNPGTTDIHSHDDGIHETTTHVTVLPIPDPIIVKCDMYAGETCRLESIHDGVSYTTSRADAFEIEYGRSTIRAKGLAVGTAKVYVKSRYGEYIKYIMEVNVLPKPPRIFTCDIPAGAECQTKWYDAVDDREGYKITSTDNTVVNVQIEQYFDSFNDISTKMERTLIEGISPGTAEVYLYKNQDHIVTIQVTVGEPVSSIGVSKANITVHQGETITVDITQGGGGYQEDSYDSEMIAFDVDTHSDGITGDVDIKGKQPSITYPVIRDQYYQTHSLKVTVLDTKLILGRETLELSGSNNEYITVREAHTGIKSFSVSNDFVSVFKRVIDGEEVLEVQANRTGTGILQVRDYDTDLGADGEAGNIAQVFIQVGDRVGAPVDTSDNFKIRYIRDWMHASNKSTSNAWSEIQVFERASNKNLAKGIVPTTDIVSPTGSLLNLTDEKIEPGFSSALWTGKSAANALNYMQLDLGNIYDVSTVNIYHFFTDGRTFNKTKTEVSADGVTWHTIFDSATEGTYPEPTDGSGKIHDVKNGLERYKGSENIDIKALLEQILGGGSIQSSEIQISSTEISQDIKDKADRLMDRWSDTQLRIFKPKFENIDIPSTYDLSYQQKMQALIVYFIEGIDARLSELRITDFEFTSDVEDGYIGGYYFQVNNLHLVQEAGIEYYNATSSSPPNGFNWKKEVIQNEGDGEFAALILPKTKYTLVRGYVIDTNGGKQYTKPSGDIISSEISLYDYYNINDLYAESTEDGVNISNGGLLTVGLLVSVLGLSGYQCTNYENEYGNYHDLSCYIAGGTVVVSVTYGTIMTRGALLKQWGTVGGNVTTTSALSVLVTNFANKLKLDKLSKIFNKSPDKVAGLGRLAANGIDRSKILESAIRIDKGVLTRVGRSLKKHSNRVDQGDIFVKYKPNPATDINYNKIAEELLKQILDDSTILVKKHTNGWIDVWSKNGTGKGFRIIDGIFDGFINPIIK